LPRPVPDTTHERLVELRDEFTRQFQMSPVLVRHASSLEGVGAAGRRIDPSIVMEGRPGGLIKATAYTDVSVFGSSRAVRSVSHEFHVSEAEGGRLALNRFLSDSRPLAGLVSQAVDEAHLTYTLFPNLIISKNFITSPLAWQLWLLTLYALAWDFPGLGYEVQGFSGFDDKTLMRPGRRQPPFTDRASFDRWCAGESELPAGEHFLWVSHDVRHCTVRAINAFLVMTGAADPRAGRAPGTAPAPGERAVQKGHKQGSKPNQLIDYMAGRDKVHYKEIADKVHGDPDTSWDAVRQNARRANEILVQRGERYEFVCDSRHVCRFDLPE
jgi:hypothetical protein